MANQYLPLDSEGIPCADPTDVDNTGMDFRQPKTIAADFLHDRDQQGYDHGYLLYPGLSSAEEPAARLWAADGEVQMPLRRPFSSIPAIFSPARQLAKVANISTTATACWKANFYPTVPIIQNGRNPHTG